MPASTKNPKPAKKSARVPAKKAARAPARRMPASARAKPRSARPTPTRALRSSASTRAMHMRELAKAEHDHRDPRAGMAKGRGRAAAVNGKQNWGEVRDAIVARRDPPTNWYRQAAKPPAK